MNFNHGDRKSWMRQGTAMGGVALSLALLAGLSPVLSNSAGASAGAMTFLLVMEEKWPKDLAGQVARLDGSLAHALPQIGVAVATSADSDFEGKVSSVPGVRAAIRDVALALEPGATEPVAIEKGPSSDDDDELFAMQWALDAVDAPEAWASGARGAGARVAVLDAGIDVDHPDLAPNLNGALSRSFLPGVPLDAPPGPPPFAGPAHHGSWVAGIVAAADNGVGTIGVAPEAELVAIRACHDTGRCDASAVIAGIVYAADVGADVLNMSINGWWPRRGGLDLFGEHVSPRQVAELMTALGRAFAYAHRHGVTTFLSAGNNGRDLDADADLVNLGQLPHTITVAATGPAGWALDPGTDLDEPACYSNYGQSVVDLAGPGGGRSCQGPFPPPPPWPTCTVVITHACFVFDMVVGPTVGGWSVSLGTSAAAPHAAGVAALVVGARGGDVPPTLVEHVVRSSADDLGKPGLDDFYGHGRVNADAATAGGG